jgi:hypothetical protein
VTEGLYGSVAYIAPEQAKSQRVGMDPRTDVYQLGLILYEMLTLSRAFPGTGIGVVLEKIEQGHYPLPRKLDPAVPRDLEAICTMALEVSPDRRYASAAAVREDLERWLEGRAPIASRSARWRTFMRTARYTVRRHPVLAAAAGMLLVGSIVYVSMPTQKPSVLGVFKKYVPEGDPRYVPLPDRGGEVEVGDSLLIAVRSSGPQYVYALSVFGTKEKERSVFPYRPWFSDPPKDAEGNDVKPADQEGTAWGLLVGAGDCDVICTKIDTAENKYEGLLVLTSAVPQPELDYWMQCLRDRSAATGGQGVPYGQALDLLAKGPPKTRGAHGSSWNDAERQGMREESRKARDEVGTLHLPGVLTSSLECRVAKK